MSWPTILCQTTVAEQAPFSNPIDPFNQVGVLIDHQGSTFEFIRLTCDAQKSTLVPAESNALNLTSAEYSELWPLILLMLVSSYGIRAVLGMFNPWR